MELTFHRDPAEFLRAADEHLAAAPVLNTVLATYAERRAQDAAAGERMPPEDWWLVVRSGRDVVGVGMRTAPFEPRPLYLLPMPDEAAVELARTLVARGEEVPAISGALPAARICLDEVARLAGGTVRVAQHTRLFELHTLVPPRPAAGRLRAAVPSEVELARGWYDAFMRDADEQAGRPPGSSPHEVPDTDAMMRRIVDGRVWVWADPDDVPVHVSGVNAPAFGAARIGPVYTPKEHRGRGYASAAVAGISARLLADGVRPCLFTDQANPTSNAIYLALGYEPVVDMANVVLD